MMNFDDLVEMYLKDLKDYVIDVTEIEDDIYYDEKVVISTSLDDVSTIVDDYFETEVKNYHKYYLRADCECDEVVLTLEDDGSVLWCGKDYCTGCMQC